MYDNDQNYGWKSYDNQSYDNRQYGGDPYGNRPRPEDMPPKKKKGGIFKKAALITPSGSAARSRNWRSGTKAAPEH